MKIKQVNIKNFKHLENFEADIDGRNILLVGENEVGKSSVIQFIEIALGKNTNIPPDAMGDGFVVADKDGNVYTFKVKVKDGKSKITIVTSDGMKDDRKSALASLVGATDFDIEEFVDLSKTASGRKEQLKIYKEKFMEPATLEEITRHEVNNKTKFDERTDINRQIKSLEAEITAHPLNNFIDLSAFQPVDVTQAIKDLQDANDNNNRVKAIEDGMVQKKNEIEELEAKLAQLKIDLSRGEDWLKKNKRVDTTELETSINGASEANQKHLQAQELIKKRDLLKTISGEAEDLTVLIETGRQAIADAIRDMEGPVEGLSFDEENLLWNGVPVHPDSLATSQIMELGIRLKYAENPTAPLFIQRTESIGQKRWELIQQFAKEKNLQIIGEKVERGKEKLQIEIMEG